MPAKRKPGDESIGVAYLRVSTDDQRLGPDAQRSVIVSWAERSSVRVVDWHSDLGVSGGAEFQDRPGLLAAMNSVRSRRAGMLIVAKRDRLARDVAVALRIEHSIASMGAKVVSADGVGNGTEPADEFLRTVIDSAAAYERALIRARTKAALAEKHKRNELTGKAPYGYRVGNDGVHLEPDEREQRVVRSILRLRTTGASLRSVVDSLSTEHPAASREGTSLGLTQVARILRSTRVSR